MEHTMFENEAGEAECVGCGRRVRFKGHKYEVVAQGDNKIMHGFSSFPGLEIGAKVNTDAPEEG
jgi:hypothetical protein